MFPNSFFRRHTVSIAIRNDFCWTLMLITKNSVFVRIVTGRWVHITVTCILVKIFAIFSLRKNETGQYISIKSTINWLSVTIIASCRKQTTFSCLIFLHIVFFFCRKPAFTKSNTYTPIRGSLYKSILMNNDFLKKKKKKKENKNKSYKTPAPGLECLHLLTPLVFQHACDEVRNL